MFPRFFLQSIFCVFFQVCAFFCLADEGRSLYLNACRASGLIETVQAEFKYVKKYGGSEKMPAYEVHISARGLFKGIHPFLAEDRKANLYLWETNVTERVGIKHPSMSVLCMGNPDYTISKDAKLRHDRGFDKNVPDYLQIDRVSQGYFTISSYPGWTPQFQWFGRANGYPVKKTLWQLWVAAGKDQKKLAKLDMLLWIKNNPETNTSYTITGKTNYDGNQQADILDVMVDGKLSKRYWIDSSRNYICPLIQNFGLDGTVIEDTAADGYILDASGLWYPSKIVFKSIKFTPDDGDRYEEYVLVSNSLTLNKKLPDGLFALDMPVGEDIFDSRIGGNIVFKAKEPVALQFKDGDIDLYSIKELTSNYTAPSQEEMEMPTPAANFSILGAVLFVIGAVCILTAIASMLYRRWKGK